MAPTRKLSIFILALIAAAGLAVSAAQSQLTIMHNQSPLSMDPANQNATYTAAVLYSMYEGLIEMNEDQEIVAALATDWSMSEDGTVIEFVLRDGVVFHDGTVFDADAVVVSFERLLDSDVGLAGAGRFPPVIERVQAIDDRTVRFELTGTHPAFLEMLTLSQARVVSPVAWQSGTLDRVAVGTGPYTFVEWVSGERVVMEANQDYWGGAPDVERLVWTWSPEMTVMTMSLQAGEVDIATPVPPAFAATLDASPRINVVEETGTRSVWIALTTTNEPLDDPRVRRALNHAIDKQALVDALLHGVGVPATSPIAPPVFGFDASLEGLQYDPELARELLAEAGYADGVTIHIAVLEDVGGFVEALQAMWAEVGVHLDIRLMEHGVYSEMQYGSPELKARENIDLVYSSWAGGGNLDADGHFRPLYHTDSWAPDFANLGFYSNERVDALLDFAASATDTAARLDAYKEVQHILIEDASHVWLYYMQALVAIRPGIEGVWVAPNGELRIRQPTLH